MHITLVDDSIAFDGYTASTRALGGAEKAFAALAGALARRGHEVVVFNRCRWGMHIEGARWETFESRKPLHTDVLVAFRRPELLEFIRASRRRVLWITAPARTLERKSARALLDAHKPLVVLSSRAQAEGWNARGLPVGLIPGAVRPAFHPAAGEDVLASPPRAVVTTHPRHGLDWLLDLWGGRIHPQAPTAELHVYSTTLVRAAEGGEVEEDLRPLAAKAQAAAAQGVRLVRPCGDTAMAECYRRAAVHLYPGHADDVTAFTLMESLACGLPAVLRPLGAAPERVENGRTAYVAPDDDAFANLAAMLLNDGGVGRSMGAEAAQLYSERTWDEAAARFEAMLA